MCNQLRSSCLGPFQQGVIARGIPREQKLAPVIRLDFRADPSIPSELARVRVV